MKQLLVNVFGGPAAGKTVVAADLFVRLKMKGLECDLVPDIPKASILDGNISVLTDPLFIFANQLRKIRKSYEVMNVVLTDSPILLALSYHAEMSENLRKLIIEEHNTFDNFNIFIPRRPEFYSNIGRVHSLTEAISVDKQILLSLDELGESYFNWGDVEEPAEYVCSEILKYFRDNNE